MQDDTASHLMFFADSLAIHKETCTNTAYDFHTMWHLQNFANVVIRNIFLQAIQFTIVHIMYYK